MAQKEQSDNTRVVIPAIQIMQETLNANKKMQEDYARLKAKYPNFKGTYEDLVKLDRQLTAKAQKAAATTIQATTPKSTYHQQQSKQAAAYQQKRADDAEKYNRALNLVGVSNMSSEEARANPDAVKAIADGVKSDIGWTVASLYPAGRAFSALRNFSRPLYNTAIGALTAESAHDMYQNGPTFWNTVGLFGGATDLGSQAYPILRQNISSYWQNMLRRGAETAMRTSADANPLEKINLGLRAYYNTEIPTNLKQLPGFLGNVMKSSVTNPRARAITRYVVTGKGKGQGYNTLSTREVINPVTGTKEPYKYSGLYDDENFYPAAGYGDVIDAYLYRTPLDPRIGIRSTEGLGIFDSKMPEGMPFYISKNYPGKAKSIPSYTLNSEPETSFVPEDLQQKVIIKSNVSSDSSPIFDRQSISLNLQSKSGFRKGFNSGGHRISIGELPDGAKVFRREDIWKFQPEDYSRRWNVNSPILRWGLEKVDRMGTPIITRTPWMPIPTISKKK